MPGNDRAEPGLEELPEQLVQTADHEHRGPVFGQFLQRGLAREEVVLDDELSAVLSAAADDEVHVGREGVADVVFEQLRRVAVPAQPLREDQGVAPVAVDVHVPRVELQDPDGSLAGGGRLFGREFVPEGELVRGFRGTGGS